MRTTYKRCVSLFLAVFLFLCCLVPPVAADDSVTDYSFYQMSSVASTFLSDAVAKDVDLSTYGIKGTTAGGLLGYSDAADESGIISGMLASALSYSSATYTYAGLYDLKGVLKTDEESDSDEIVGTSLGLTFWEYAQYGKLLNEIGFDSTGSESSFIGHGLRWISGNLLWLAYMALNVIGSFMDLLVGVLWVLNPFRFVRPPEVTLQDGSLQYFDTSTTPGLSDFANLMGNLYALIWDYAPLIAGIWLVVLAVGLLMGPKEGGTWPRIKRFLIRAFALVIGLPLLAVTYTQVLDAVRTSDLFISPAIAADNTIASTLVDFENWAMGQRLASPVKYDSSPHAGNYILQAQATMVSGSFVNLSPTTTTYANLSKSALAINDIATSYDWKKADGETEKNSGVTDSLITRYTNSNQVTASDFELYAKTSLSASDLEDLAGKAGTTVKKFSDNAVDLLAEGSLNRDIFSNGGSKLATFYRDSSYVQIGDIIDYSRANRLSTMSMYNYLSSRFDANSMIVYSNEKASSGFVRESHYSVNLIGTGLTAFMFWFSAIVQIGLVAAIGWLWCLGLIINSLRRTIRMCMAIPGAMLGSVKSIAHILVYIFMMFLEIMLTAFLFQVVAAMVVGIKNVFSDMATGVVQLIQGNSWSGTIAGIDISSTATTGVSGELAVNLSGSAIVLITQVIPTAGLILFVVMLFRLRGSVLKSVDEGLTKMICRMFGVEGAAGTTGMPPAVAAGLGAGAGAVAASKLAGGGGSNEKSDKQIESGSPPAGQVEAGANGDEQQVESGEGQASLESGDAAGDGGDGGGGDVNISDNDTATAAFDADGEAESQAAENGDTLNSLNSGESLETADGGNNSGQLDDTNDAVTGEYDSESADAAVEAAGGDSVEDVQDTAQTLGEQAEASQTGASAASGVGGKHSGEQSAGQGTKSGAQGKTGEASGKSGQSGQSGQSGKNATSKADGQTAEQAAAAVAGTAGAAGIAGAASGSEANQSGVKSGSDTSQSGVAGVGSGAGSAGQSGAGGTSDKSGEAGVAGVSAGEQGGLATPESGNVGAAAVPEGGASASLGDAYARNMEAKSRLAELEAQVGASGGAGAAGAPAGGTPGGAGTGTTGEGVSSDGGKLAADNGKPGTVGAASGTSRQAGQNTGGLPGSSASGQPGVSSGSASGGPTPGQDVAAGATVAGAAGLAGAAAGTVGATQGVGAPGSASGSAPGSAPGVASGTTPGNAPGGAPAGGIPGVPNQTIGAVASAPGGQVGGRRDAAPVSGAVQSGVSGTVGAVSAPGVAAAAGQPAGAAHGGVASSGVGQGQVDSARVATPVGAAPAGGASAGTISSGAPGQIGGSSGHAPSGGSPTRMGPSPSMGPQIASESGQGQIGGARVAASPGAAPAGRVSAAPSGGAAPVQNGGVSPLRPDTTPMGGGQIGQVQSAPVQSAPVQSAPASGGVVPMSGVPVAEGGPRSVRLISEAPGGGPGNYVVAERSGIRMRSDMRAMHSQTEAERHTKVEIKPEPKKKSTAGIAAQAAVAAMMASSQNSILRGAGQAMGIGMMSEMSAYQAAKADAGVTMTEDVKFNSELSSMEKGENAEAYQTRIREQIENLDADTAAIEARIRELEQQRASQRNASRRSLSEQTGEDDYG